MPQPPKKRSKKSLATRQRETRERNRILRRAESTPEREIRRQKDRERRRRRTESTPEREKRLREDRERKRRRKAESTPSVVKCETAQKPSRRAAIIASKKISNTICNYNLEGDPDVNANDNVPPKPPVKTEKALKQNSLTPPPLPPPPIEIGLNMECEEEILSETQAETLSKAQSRYNLVMKGLRELVQCNVKVTFVDVC